MDWADCVAETIIDGAIEWDGNVHAGPLWVAIPEALRAAYERGKLDAIHAPIPFSELHNRWMEDPDHAQLHAANGGGNEDEAARAAVEGHPSARYPFAPPRSGRFR